MINKTTIHETVIRDIVDIVTDAKKVTDDTMELNKPSSRRSFGSISKASQGLTMVFPLLVDRSLSIETASMIAKAKERKCVTMLQILFSAICITDSKDGFEHISKVHKNLDIGRINVDDFIVYMDNLVDEGAIQIIDQKKYQAVMEDFKTMEFPMTDPINEESLESYKVHHDANGLKVVKESIGKDTANIFKNLTDAQKNTNMLLQQQLIDTDTRKANEIIPTMMIVRYVSNSPGNSVPIPEEIVVGVN